MIVVNSPTELRKAAAFVEKLAELEREFGFSLALGREETLSGEYGADPVTFGPGACYAVIRSSDDDLPGGLALALVPAS